MAQDTYHAQGIVLRKTKLGETDLVVTMLREDGQQLRAVAKGARKPKSQFASRLELGSVVRILCVRGRSLDIVKEAHIIYASDVLRRDFLRAIACEPMLELAEKVCQDGLDIPLLYPMTEKALRTLEACDEQDIAAVTATYLIKVVSLIGFRPSLSDCCICGAPVVADQANVPFNHAEGGVVCPACAAHNASGYVDANLVGWMGFFISRPFQDVCAAHPGSNIGFAVLEHCQLLTMHHVGNRLKSLEFMRTCGMYE